MKRMVQIREECKDEYRTMSDYRPLLYKAFEVKEGREMYGQKTYVHNGKTFFEEDLEFLDED